MTTAEERARELAQNIVNRLNEECVLTDLEGTHIGFDPDDGYPLVQSLLVKALAAERLEEAKWWHLEVALTAMHTEIIDSTIRDECRARIEGLEQAAGEKPATATIPTTTTE
jgi:hypothetical protein